MWATQTCLIETSRETKLARVARASSARRWLIVRTWAQFEGCRIIQGTFLKKPRNASRPSEHPQSGRKLSKRLGGTIGCKYKIPSWHLNGFPDIVVTLGHQYNAGEKLTVMLYTYYINRHAGTPRLKQNKNIFSTWSSKKTTTTDSSSVIDPCTTRAYSLEHEQCYML